VTPQATVANLSKDYRENINSLRPMNDNGHFNFNRRNATSGRIDIPTSTRPDKAKHVSFRPSSINPHPGPLNISDPDVHYFRLNKRNLCQCETESKCNRLNSPRRWVASLPDGHEEIPEIRQPSCLFTLHPDLFGVPVSINSRDVVALLDSGASENFISTKLVNTLKLPTKRLDFTYFVKVATGQEQRINRMCQLNVCFVREPNSISFRVIDMDPELVLGIPFLRTFQPQIDWVGKTI